MATRKKSDDDLSPKEKELLHKKIELADLEIEKLKREKENNSLPFHRRLQIDTKINVFQAVQTVASIALGVMAIGAKTPQTQKPVPNPPRMEQIAKPSRLRVSPVDVYKDLQFPTGMSYTAQTYQLDINRTIDELKNTLQTSPPHSVLYRTAHSRLSRMSNDSQLTDAQRGKILEILSRPTSIGLLSAWGPLGGGSLDNSKPKNLQFDFLPTYSGSQYTRWGAAGLSQSIFNLSAREGFDFRIEQMETKLKGIPKDDLFERGVVAGQLMQLLENSGLTDLQINKINTLIKIAKSPDNLDA